MTGQKKTTVSNDKKHDRLNIFMYLNVCVCVAASAF